MADSIQEQESRIPESITINGVTYSIKETPELQELVKSVSKVEKNKLYSQFQNLKQQIENLNKVQVETNTGLDINKLVETLRGEFVTKGDLENGIKNAVSEVVQPILQKTELDQKAELSAYREKLISDNIAICIPELVKGETKEQLDATLQDSIKLRASYPSPSSVQSQPTHVVDPLIARQMAEANAHNAARNKETPAPQASVGPIPAIPGYTSREIDGSPTPTKGMSMGDFAQQRESLKQQLEAMYGN